MGNDIELREKLIILHLTTPPNDAYTRFCSAGRLAKGETVVVNGKKSDAAVLLAGKMSALTCKYGIPLFNLQCLANARANQKAYFILPNSEPGLPRRVTLAELRADLAQFVADIDELVWMTMPRLG